ncbi:hypothetical protein [Nocardioides mangrovi]|uniref:Uncharacterized protein n=1 Tax=Nocardioides mangrovi TaxID=2874580 RepID=A0ABS7UEJ7_9ACTN|nr:hypothetical protein [Nocardioides mangrovi]MBZ5739297.1 hypothetical protein [Nocardioides mangrovi]
MLKFLLVVILVAIAVYLATRAIQNRGITPAPRRTQRRPQQPPRVMGPDDDPDFLRDLDRKRRHPEDPES